MPDTWKCHVCRDERPDEKISVYSTEREFYGTLITQNVRYCNDRQACIDGAKDVSWLPES